MLVIRAKYVEHMKRTRHRSGYNLYDVYYLLHVVQSMKKGDAKIVVPHRWIMKDGSIGNVESPYVDSLTDLLVVEGIPQNIAGRVVLGLTNKGRQLLKENLEDLKDCLPVFALTGEDISFQFPIECMSMMESELSRQADKLLKDGYGVFVSPDLFKFLIDNKRIKPKTIFGTWNVPVFETPAGKTIYLNVDLDMECAFRLPPCVGNH